MPPSLVLANYRTLLDQILATAVDDATWTDAIFDQALRLALANYNDRFVYETSFEVLTTGYSQNLSTISALRDILAVAYPWSDGASFASLSRRFRTTADLTVYFDGCQPADGEFIRVRHTKQHTIDDLDSAAATTVPDRHATLLATYAASHACRLRRRQLSENPAIPDYALAALTTAATDLYIQATDLLRTARIADNPSWQFIGL